MEKEPWFCIVAAAMRRLVGSTEVRGLLPSPPMLIEEDSGTLGISELDRRVGTQLRDQGKMISQYLALD